MRKEYFPSNKNVFFFGKYVYFMWLSICLLGIGIAINRHIILGQPIDFSPENKEFIFYSLPFWIFITIFSFLFYRKSPGKIITDESTNSILVLSLWKSKLFELKPNEITKIEFKKTKLNAVIEKKNKEYYHPKDLWIHISNGKILKVAWQMENYTNFVKYIEEWSGLKLPEEDVKWLEKNRGNADFINQTPDFKFRKNN